MCKNYNKACSGPFLRLSSGGDKEQSRETRHKLAERGEDNGEETL